MARIFEVFTAVQLKTRESLKITARRIVKLPTFTWSECFQSSLTAWQWSHYDSFETSLTKYPPI